MGMRAPDQHLLAPGTERTIAGVDIREVPRLRQASRDRTGDGRRSRVLPVVTLGASMRMSPVPVRVARRRGQRGRRRPFGGTTETHLDVRSSGVAPPGPPPCKPEPFACVLVAGSEIERPLAGHSRPPLLVKLE